MNNLIVRASLLHVSADTEGKLAQGGSWFCMARSPFGYLIFATYFDEEVIDERLWQESLGYARRHAPLDLIDVMIWLRRFRPDAGAVLLGNAYDQIPELKVYDRR